MPDSDKTLSIEAFVRCGDIDDLYLRPALLSRALDARRRRIVRACCARACGHEEGRGHRPDRAVPPRADRVGARPRQGLIATTLNFDYEVRSAEEAFDDIPDVKIEAEMLDLARHIIKTKTGHFDPKQFDDRYEDGAGRGGARQAGRASAIEPRKAPTPTKVVDLMAALRESAKGTDPKPAKAPAKSTRRAAVEAASAPAGKAA